MRKLLEVYKSLHVDKRNAELEIVPFKYNMQLDEFGKSKAKGHDLQLYDVHSEAAFYSVKGVCDKTYRVFAFIGKPTTPMPKNGYPAVVLAHGGAGIAYFEWVEHWVSRGYVAIAPDLGGHYAKNGLERNLPNEIGSPEGEVERMGSFFQTNDVENSWMYFGVTALGTAINALQEYTKIDMEKLALVGISWGGVLSLHTAGVEPRFKAVSIIYSSAFITNTTWAMETHNVKSLMARELSIYGEYLDPSASIEGIRCPILFTAGMDDVAFTMLNRKLTIDKIQSCKTFAFRPHFVHGHWEGWTPMESYLFTDVALGISSALPSISMDVTDGVARIEIQNAQEKCKIYVCYTTEMLDRQVNQSYEEIQVDLTDAECIFELPNGTTACFARYIMKDGASFSTNLIMV